MTTGNLEIRLISTEPSFNLEEPNQMSPNLLAPSLRVGFFPWNLTISDLDQNMSQVEFNYEAMPADKSTI